MASSSSWWPQLSGDMSRQFSPEPRLCSEWQGSSLANGSRVRPPVSMWSPLTCCGRGDLTRVIWGQSLSSELILGSKTVINCTWARGGAAVVREGGVFYDHSGLGSDHPWPWWHRDNGSHGDTDMVITMLRREHSEVMRGAPSMGGEQWVGVGEKMVGWEKIVCIWPSGAEKILFYIISHLIF